jgi:hypothetical protein
MGNIAIYTASPAVLWKRRQAANVSPSVTPSISVTPSNTPEPGPISLSPTPTVTPTVTPTITPTPSCTLGFVSVSVGNTKGLVIDGVQVNTNNVTYVSGDNFSLGQAQSGLFSYTFAGASTFDIVGSTDNPACLCITDCNSNVTCKDVNGGFSESFPDQAVDCGCTVYISLTDGACA